MATFAPHLRFHNITQVVRIREKPSFEEETRFIVLGLSTSNLRYLAKKCQRNANAKKIDNLLETDGIRSFGLKVEIVDFRLSYTALNAVAPEIAGVGGASTPAGGN